MVVSGSCPMAPASEVTRPQHRVWLESHSHSNAPERTRDCAIPGTLRELPKSQRCLDRIEMGEHVRRGSGLQEKGLKRMHTGLSRVLSTPVLNYECYVEWWRSAREPGEHQSHLAYKRHKQPHLSSSAIVIICSFSFRLDSSQTCSS